MSRVCAQSWGLTSVWPQKVTRPTRRTSTTTLSRRETPPTRAGCPLSPPTTTPWPPPESARSAPPSHTSPIMHSAPWAWSWAGWSWRPTGSLRLDTSQQHGISLASICTAFYSISLVISSIVHHFLWLVRLQAAGTAAGEGERVSVHPATSAGGERPGDQTTEAAIWARRSVL